jgi:hypothetical protein
MSLAFGAGNRALAAGTAVVGANSVAGCKGFYWFEINYSNQTIRLSTS